MADELLRSGATGPQALGLADAILDALHDAGLDQDDAQDAYDLFLTYVLGSTGRQTTATAPARWRASEPALDHAEPDTYPALRRATRSGTTRDDDARFAGSLDLVVDAIAGRTSHSLTTGALAQPRSASPPDPPPPTHATKTATPAVT